MFKLILAGIVSHLGLLKILHSERGTAGDDKVTLTQAELDAKIQEATKGALTQDKVDVIVKERLAREAKKYSDYEDLKKFKTEYEKKQDELTLKEQEAKKEYEKAKESYEKKIKDLNGVITDKDRKITSMTINHALMGEVTKQNAYAEETIALIKDSASIKDGIVTIKGKDKNGLEVALSVADGVKQFLEKRPHLVKAKGADGGGTGSGAAGDGGAGSGSGDENDLNSLNMEYLKAINIGDHKRAKELKAKIEANFTKRGVSRQV